MNKTVKYHNKFNTVALKDFNEGEMNILFSLIAQVRDKELTEVVFTFDELKEKCKYKPSSNASKKDFVKALLITKDKLKVLDYKSVSDDGYDFDDMTLFPTFSVRGREGILKIAVNPALKDLFNHLKVFTTFELVEYVSISSIYAKTAYRNLKQFRTQGWWYVTLEDFRRIMDAPVSYSTSDIDKRVINPIIKLLGGTEENAIFRNLRVEKDKRKGRGRGGVLVGYYFRFDKEKSSSWVDGKFDKPEMNPKSFKRNTIREVIPESFLIPGTETPLTPEESLELDLRIAKTQLSWKKGE